MDNWLSNDDDIRKITRLQLINASARFELLSANQQLIDFHLNRVMKTMHLKKQARDKQALERAGSDSRTGNYRKQDQLSMNQVDEVSETEENNTTQNKIGVHVGSN